MPKGLVPEEKFFESLQAFDEHLTAKLSASIKDKQAIENNLFLLHNDSDFDRTSKVVGLKIFRL